MNTYTGICETFIHKEWVGFSIFPILTFDQPEQLLYIIFPWFKRFWASYSVNIPILQVEYSTGVWNDSNQGTVVS